MKIYDAGKNGNHRGTAVKEIENNKLKTMKHKRNRRARNITTIKTTYICDIAYNVEENANSQVNKQTKEFPPN